MRTLLTAIALTALPASAQAYCFPVPDTADTAYVENSLRRTLCLQQELEQSTRDRALRTLIDAQLSQLQRDMLQQKLLLQRMQVDALKLP